MTTNINRQRQFGNIANSPNGDQSSDRPKAKVWVDVGIMSVNEETGEDMFINLPSGIPVDNVDEQRITTSNANMRALLTTKNALLRQFKEVGAELAPGEESILSLDEQSGLAIRIRRNAEHAEASDDANPHSKALARVRLNARSAGLSQAANSDVTDGEDQAA